MKITETSNLGLDIIKEFEGFRSKPYLCPANVWTIGYGTTVYPNGVRVSKNDAQITKEQADELLKSDVVKFAKKVESFTRDDINQNQFDALVSFSYNLGYEALRKSTLLKKVNVDPNDTKITNEFNKWVYAGGRKLNGLIRRRKKESELYFKKL